MERSDYDLNIKIHIIQIPASKYFPLETFLVFNRFHSTHISNAFSRYFTIFLSSKHNTNVEIHNMQRTISVSKPVIRTSESCLDNEIINNSQKEDMTFKWC